MQNMPSARVRVQSAERMKYDTDALYLAAGLSAVFVLGGMFFSHRLVRLLGR